MKSKLSKDNTDVYTNNKGNQHRLKAIRTISRNLHYLLVYNFVYYNLYTYSFNA